jgi:hypothetical protein
MSLLCFCLDLFCHLKLQTEKLPWCTLPSDPQTLAFDRQHTLSRKYDDDISVEPEDFSLQKRFPRIPAWGGGAAGPQSACSGVFQDNWPEYSLELFAQDWNLMLEIGNIQDFLLKHSILISTLRTEISTIQGHGTKYLTNPSQGSKRFNLQLVITDTP